MKSLKPTVINISDLYATYLGGGEVGWFAFVQSENDFYHWNGSSWSVMPYTDSPDTIEVGAYYVEGEIGGITGTFHVVNYVDYLGVSKRVIHHIEAERVYFSNEELFQNVPTYTSSFESIPLLQYQKAPALTIAELYLRYPNGGERGWYAMIDSENSFAYWETDTNEWLLLGGGAGGGIEYVAGDNVTIDKITNPKKPRISATGSPQVQSDWNATEGKGVILNKPTIPTIDPNTVIDADYAAEKVAWNGKMKGLFQATAPTAPKLNDVWISSATLIAYNWLGAWVNLSLIGIKRATNAMIVGGNAASVNTSVIMGGDAFTKPTDYIMGGDAGFNVPIGNTNASSVIDKVITGGNANTVITYILTGGNA